jgi:hypothetical protein
MSTPLHFRFQEWLADHFGFQYPKPRVGPREPSRWLLLGKEFALTTARWAFLGFVGAIWLIRALSVRRGQIPVPLLFLAALLALLSTLRITFVI